MTISFASLGLGGLTTDEKLEVVGQLWDELHESAPPGSLLTEAQRDELRRRQADAIANPDDWVSWEDARAATLKRLSRES